HNAPVPQAPGPRLASAHRPSETDLVEHMTTPNQLSPTSLARKVGYPRAVGFALGGLALAAAAGVALAQDSDQQVRCMQLQQELASAQGGGGGGCNTAGMRPAVSA